MFDGSMPPDGTVVNLGCGLDTTFDRVDNGRVGWFDLDLPEVIELRRQFIPETDRRRCIAASALSREWFDQVEAGGSVMLMAAGVLYYFSECDVRHLFRNLRQYFGSLDFVFDYSSSKGVEIANKRVIRDGVMDAEAELVWGIDNICELEQWDCGVTILKNMPIFKQFKQNYPLQSRIGMNLSDALKLMSVAYIRIG